MSNYRCVFCGGDVDWSDERTSLVHLTGGQVNPLALAASATTAHVHRKGTKVKPYDVVARNATYVVASV